MWLVQYSGSDRFRVDNTNQVLEVLAAKKYPFAAVGMLPFSSEMTGLENLDLTGKVTAYGSCKMVRVVSEMGLTPGVYFDYSAFNVLAWREYLAEFMLNDFKVCSIRDFRNVTAARDIFIRPVMDLKMFSGTVVPEGTAFEEFFATKFNGTDYNDNALVAYADPKEILAEWRVFIVNRRAVTGSLYRMDGELKPSTDFPASVARWAENIAERYWLPHDNCVMDVAMTTKGLHIMEFNCINASGLYKADVEKFVDAMNSLMI